MEKLCNSCGKILTRKKHKRGNRPCGYQWERKRQFEKRKYCSHKCYWKSLEQQIKGGKNPYWKPKISKICPACKKRFQVLPSRNKRIYCSIKCVGLFHREKKRTGKILRGKGGPLKAHHLLSAREFPQYILEVNNGITLCKYCHKELNGSWN